MARPRRFPTDKEIEAQLLPYTAGPASFFAFSDTEKKYRELVEQPLHSLDLCPADTPPPDTQAAFEDVFADLIKSHGATLRLHPTMRRWTVYLKRKDGQYEPAIIICENWNYDDPLPKDLENSLDPRLHILVRGKVGEYRVPTRQDFEHLRYKLADIQYLGGHRQAAANHRLADLERNRAKSRDRMNWIRGFVNYYAQDITREINRRDGSMQGLPFVPQTSIGAIEKEYPAYEEVEALDPETGKPLGYKHRRRLSAIERELEPTVKKLLAAMAAQERWRAEVKQARDDMRPATVQLLRLTEPMISEEERARRVAALAGAQQARADGAADALEEMVKAARDEAERRVADSMTNIEEAQAKIREEERQRWLSRVQPQALSQT